MKYGGFATNSAEMKRAKGDCCEQLRSSRSGQLEEMHKLRETMEM